MQQRMQGKMSADLNAIISMLVICPKNDSFVTKNDSRTIFLDYKLVKDSNQELSN